MISAEDCIAMCGLSREEVRGVAEHEHIPETAAAALASYLMHRAGGPQEICRMLVDDIREAVQHDRIDHAGELFSALRHFIDQHPNTTAN